MKSDWPSIKDQLDAAKVTPGSALEKLIRENQDFDLLRPEEANDDIGIPPWLRVHWRKNHPDHPYSAIDPYGAYPETLHHIHAWMLAHQHLPKGPAAEEAAPSINGATS